MSSGEINEVSKGELSLSGLFLPDTPEAKAIESLQGKEYEYSAYLGTIEYTIARYFYEDNREIKDKDAIAALNNILKNSDKSISFFKQGLETEIVESLIELFKDEPISRHEFELIIDYILDIILNRAWMQDEQAYLKWVTYIMDLFTEEESEEYENSIRKFAAKMGLSSKHADLMLMKGEEEDYFEFIEKYVDDIGPDEGFDAGEDLTEEELLDEMELKFLSLPEAEKFDFLLENGSEFYELVGFYLLELAEKGEFEKIQELYRSLVEKYDDFLYLYVYMGGIYVDLDPDLAKLYFEKALKSLDKFGNLSDPSREILRTNLLDLLARIK